MNQSKLTKNTRDWQEARENVRERVTIGFGLTSDWLKKWGKFLNQSLSVVMQNQSKRKLIMHQSIETRPPDPRDLAGI